MRKSQLTAATCLKATAIPLSTPHTIIRRILRRPPDAAERKASWESISGSSMNNSVFADVPCTSGSVETSANRAAATAAQGRPTKREAKKKRAQADDAENSSAMTWTERIDSNGRLKARWYTQ